MDKDSRFESLITSLEKSTENWILSLLDLLLCRISEKPPRSNSLFKASEVNELTLCWVNKS